MPENIKHVDPYHVSGVSFGPAVLAIGMFDGMHLGHRALFAQAKRKAEQLQVPLIAVTFDNDPDEVFRADDPAFGKLLSNETRLGMIAEQADIVMSLPASADVLALEPAAFLEFLENVSHPLAIFTGADFRFGAKARGTGVDIGKWGELRGCEYISCELLEQDGEVVSATRIRAELLQGNVAEAKRLLAGRAHSVCGYVEQGRGEGTGFGFATANLDLSASEVMLPREGVYAAYADVCGKRYAAAVNVGVARSFENARAQVEAHLLDFSGDLYGKDLVVEFEHWLREPRVFASKEELISTVMGNIEWVREHMGSI